MKFSIFSNIHNVLKGRHLLRYPNVISRGYMYHENYKPNYSPRRLFCYAQNKINIALAQ